MTLHQAAYFRTSNTLSVIARDAVGRSAAQPREAIVAVVFSAFYVEGAINDVIHKAVSTPPEAFEETEQRLRTHAIAAELESRKASADMKLQVISASVRDKLFEKGAQPFQDFALLMDLRNAIAHHKPEDLALG